MNQGDRLAIQLPDTLELMILIFACAYVGVIAVPIDSTRFPHELEYMLDKTQPRGIILMTSFDGINYVDHLSRICPEINMSRKGELASTRFTELKHVIIVKQFVGHALEFDSNEAFANVWEYDEVFSGDLIKNLKLPKVDPHDIFIILFTVFKSVFECI